MSCKIHWECEDEPCPYCEIDSLKGELEDTIKYCKPYGGNPRVCAGMQAHKDLERQLDASQALLAEAMHKIAYQNQFYEGLRGELKALQEQLAEAKESEAVDAARIHLFDEEVKDLRKQLIEARAENERLNSVDHYACALCPDVAQARQEAARSIIQIISMETVDRPFEQSQAVEIIRQRFGLEKSHE